MIASNSHAPAQDRAHEKWAQWKQIERQADDASRAASRLRKLASQARTEFDRYMAGDGQTPLYDAAEDAAPFQVGGRVRFVDSSWTTGPLPLGWVRSREEDGTFGVEWDDQPGRIMVQDVDSLEPVAEAALPCPPVTVPVNQVPEVQQSAAKCSKPKKTRKSAKAEPPAAPAGVCRICGCTEADCRGCVERTGEPCTWASAQRTLCSACLPLLETELQTLAQTVPIAPALLRKLAAAGFRCVGHVAAPEALGKLQKEAGLTKAQAIDLGAAVGGWLKSQLEPDYPTNPTCQQCGKEGGRVVEMPSQFEADDDICPCDVIDHDLLTAAGVAEEEAENLWMCKACHEKLTAFLAKKKPRKPKKAKA